MKRIIKTILKVLMLLPIVIWIGTLLRCDILTLIHGNEFKEIYSADEWLGDLDYLKILDYSESYARVYYVTDHRSGGDTVSFVKEDGEWVFYEWNTIWSTDGSASEVIWPYWWHFIYGGF